MRLHRRYVLLCTFLAALSLSWLAHPPTPAQARITKELKEELLPKIQAGLNSKNAVEKSYAILAAGKLKDRKLDKELLPFLANTNTSIRHAAIVAFASRKDRKGLQALEKEINDAASNRSKVMAQLLPQLPPKVQESFLKGMISGRKVDVKLQNAALVYITEYAPTDGPVFALLNLVTKGRKPADRAPYLKVLNRNPQTSYLPIAQKLFSNTRDTEARKEGLKLALNIGTKEADVLARKALSDKEESVRDIALSYLATRQDLAASNHILKELPNIKRDAVRSKAIATVLRMGHKVPLPIAQKVLDAAGNDEDKLAEAYKLYGATQTTEALETLVKLERSTKIEERRHAIRGLAYTKSSVPIDTILKRSVFDGDEDVRELSIEALGLLGRKEAVPLLRTALQKTAEKEYKEAILTALGRIKHASAAEVLKYNALSPDKDLKAIALEGLANIQDSSSIDIIERLTEDRDAQTRWNATLLLVQLNQKRGLSKLSNVLQRPPEDITEGVLNLPKQHQKPVIEALLAFPKENIRDEAILILEKLGPDAAPYYRNLVLNKTHEDTYDTALAQLLRRNDTADVNLFKRMSQTGTDDEKMLALAWLTRRASPELTPFFRTLLRGAKGNLPLQQAAMYAILTSEA